MKYIAQWIPTTPTEVLRAGDNASTALAQSFDNLWYDIFKSPGIYTAIVNVSLLVALVALAIFLVQWGRKMMQEGKVALDELLPPILCIVVLSNNGAILSDVILDLHSISEGVNDKILSVTVNELSFQEAFQTAVAKGSTGQLAAKVVEFCSSETTPERIDACIDQKTQQFSDYLNIVRETTGDTDASIWDSIQDYLGNGIGAASGLVGTYAVAPIVSIFLMAVHAAFSWVLEIAAILVSLTAPLSVALSMLPTQAKPFFVWLSSFLGLAVAKAGLNIISGLGATVAVTATDTFNPLVFSIFIGIMSPTLALLVGSGSTTGLLVALSYITTKMTTATLKMATLSIMKGIRGIRRR